MFNRLSAIVACAGLAAPLLAQTIEFRIVEESPTANSVVTASAPSQGTPLTSANPHGNYAVQARVTSGQAFGGADIEIVIQGEPDADGTLVRLRIQGGGTPDGFGNTDFSYWNGAATTSNGPYGGARGMAIQYSYLCGINNLNCGVINGSVGSFTNTPGSQEIVYVTLAAVGSEMLAVPGLDPLQEGNPVTWPEYGAGETPANGTTAALPADIGATYFAQGQFVDIFRFRYTPNTFTPRTLNITVQNVMQWNVFTQLFFANGAWGAANSSRDADSITISPLVVPVGILGACCDSTGSCASVIQSMCASGSSWTQDGSCSPNPCRQPGACCHSTGCSIVMQSSECGGGQFRGTGSACATPGTPATCCPADFNGSGTLTVQDIFAFLNAWFAGDPRADFTGDGHLSVYDIFYFLNAWFAGCP